MFRVPPANACAAIRPAFIMSLVAGSAESMPFWFAR
jgi:hypothetical protein